LKHYDTSTDLVVGAGVQAPWPGALYNKPVVIHSHSSHGALRRSYLPEKTLDGLSGHYCGVGSTDSFGMPLQGLGETASAQSLLNVDSAVQTIGKRVSDSVVAEVNKASGRLTSAVSTAAAQGVERMTSAAGVGLDRFLDSPAGTALLTKIEDKVDRVASNALQKRQVELAALGIAGLALVMGSVSVGSRMSRKQTIMAFALGATAVGLVASGALAPPEPPAPKLPSRR